MYWKLLDPDSTKVELRRSTKKLTVKDMAQKIGVDPGALGRALRRQRVWASTVLAIAEAVGKDPLDIAQESTEDEGEEDEEESLMMLV